jgi:Zn-dependent peptidase ImmA (M78 family)
MANYVSGVNPSLLRWAREKAGYSLEDIAARLKKDARDIALWEAGEAVPTYNQLEKLAYSYYKRPVAIFFFPEPPEEPEPKEAFRTLPDFEIQNLQPDTRYAIREAQAMQLSLYELSGGVNLADKLIFRDLQLKPRMSVVRAANKVRAYLNIPLEVQFEWSTTTLALKKWRESIQNHGIFVFKRSFKQRDISGFCLADSEFPVIYLNNSTSKTRQVFSLFHELAHLLLNTSGITKVNDNYIVSLSGRDRDIEVFCNHFAAEFLVPSRDFDSRLDLSKPVERVIDNLSRHYNVSREVILRKLLDRGIVDQDYYDSKVEEWFEEFQESRKSNSGGGYYYATQTAYLGEKYINLAFSRYYSGQCTLQQLADYLNIKPRSVIGLEQYMLSKAL